MNPRQRQLFSRTNGVLRIKQHILTCPLSGDLQKFIGSQTDSMMQADLAGWMKDFDWLRVKLKLVETSSMAPAGQLTELS